MPIAINAAERSSGMIRQWISGCLIKASETGAQREPGERIASVTPLLAQMEAK